MQEQIARLVEQRARTWEAAKALLDGAGEQGLDAEGRASFDRMNSEIDTLDADIKGLAERSENASKADEYRARFASQPQGTEERKTEEPSLNAQLRDVLRGDSRGLEISPSRLLGPAEARALLTTTATSGPAIVRDTFVARLIEALTETSGVLQANATVIPTTSGEPMTFPKLTSKPTAARVAEGGTIPKSDGGFNTFTLNSYKYAVISQLSRELAEDNEVDLTGLIARLAGEAVGDLLGLDLLTGDNSSKPNGALTTATSGATSPTAKVGVPDADTILTLVYSINSKYRRNARFLMDDSTVGKLRGLKDGNGQFMWAPGMTAGEPATLFGYPVVTDANVPDTALNAKSVLFGDFTRYWVRMVRGIRIERSDEYGWDSDLVSFKAVVRADGDLSDTTGAIKYAVGAAS